ncbi:hypothetical protein [Erwinia oleae]|uniref:hypothetical protein n=1 Tax=Erwinia oleae TaxID=796334 RepID=UPI001269F46F|nr:hypothetical protein [Erwinia oleae]
MSRLQGAILHSDDDSNNMVEIHAVIGRAVAALLESGQSPHIQNLITMLQVHGAQAMDKSQKEIFLLAKRFITEKMH